MPRLIIPLNNIFSDVAAPNNRKTCKVSGQNVKKFYILVVFLTYRVLMFQIYCTQSFRYSGNRVTWYLLASLHLTITRDNVSKLIPPSKAEGDKELRINATRDLTVFSLSIFKLF